MIKLTSLTKKFGELTAVDNLNLNIDRGEIFGLIGPNGAGKTTTIKMMVGILPPTSGSIEIEGFDIKDSPVEAKKLIGYIPDVPYVYPYMTGREFLHFVSEIYEVKNSAAKIKKLLKIFPLEEMLDGYFKEFSRGTKQKLSIIASLIHDPEVLIIDEPILGLDPESSLITKSLLRKLSGSGRTVFICTHTLTFVEEICTEIGIIDKGRLIFEGKIGNLKEKLQSKEGNLEKLYLKITKDAK